MAGITSLERRVVLDTYGKLLWQLRLQPWHAAVWMAGVFLPPHERLWLGVFFGDAKENNVIASRGTSKSFTHASLAAPLKATLYKNVNILTLSASGFRGGKELFKDAARLFDGQLKSQEPPGVYLKAGVAEGKKTISKDPSIWTMELRSHSRYATAPTNNPDQLRGLRTNTLLIDERNTYPGEQVHKILRPMMAVGSDFKRAAAGGDSNKIYQVSTIDFTVRDWYPEIQVAEDLQKREYAAAKARKEGDWAEYERLMAEKDGQLRTASFTYTKLDYTDLLIPEYVNTLDGERRYRVEYPREKGVERDDVLRYDEQDQIAYWYTYPVDKKGQEQPLRDGTADEEIWLAEYRNQFISSSGNVFPHDLIQKAAERPIPTGKVKRRRAEDEDGESTEEFFAPVMLRCGDPCVLGIDVARESDETTFVVYRLGELAEGDFSPFVERLDAKGRPCLGRTDWNHICWAESHRHMQAHDAAAKVHDLFERYNIISTAEVGGIGMDLRGGGSSVRDELGNPKPTVVDGKADPDWAWDQQLKMYDPEDTGGFSHYAAYDNPKEYWGGLRLLATQNQDNVEWTYGMRAMMQQKKLYIAFWMPPSRWAFEKGLLGPNGEPDKFHPDYQAWEVGYTGIRRLKMQLLRLQTKVTETGVQRFVAPGDRTKEEGKKDLWAGSIYGFSLAREHINRQTVQATAAPMVAPLVVEIGSGYQGDDDAYRRSWL